MSKPLKTRNVNIGSEAEPKFMKIQDYWGKDMVAKVDELLHEYKDLFPKRFSHLKGIIGDLGVMNITLKPNAKPFKQRPYRLNSDYKEKMHQELEKMLDASIIEPMEESDWVSPMVVPEKKQKGKIKIYIDLRNLNDACVHNQFPMPFIDKVLENFGG